MNDIELFAENELTVAESDERTFHEKVVDDVKDGIEKLAGIGDASLKVLRDKRLYRVTHKTFEEYCQERFGIVRTTANRGIAFAGVLENLMPHGIKILPATEGQARSLTKLQTPELQAQAWTQAQTDSGKEQPSNREVAEAVAKVQAELEAERQARETDRLIKRHINTTRYLLLDMRDRKGWKALGYESFVEYGEKELNLGTARIYQLADAGEISLQIGFSTLVENQPKETHLRPLKAVPEAERKAIWEEATRKAEEEGAKLTAKRIEDEVKKWKQTAKHHQDIADSIQHELALERQRSGMGR